MEKKDIRQILDKQYEYVNDLNIEIRDIIKRYTGSFYYKLNKKLRENEELSYKYKTIVNKLDSTFNACPIIKDEITVYRGIQSDNFIPELISYISTSYDIDEAIKHSGIKCCLLKILIPPGSKILPIENISEYHGEKEILLHRLGKLNITSREYKGRLLIYNLVYIPINSVEINSNTNIKKVKRELDIETISDKIVSFYDEMQDQLYEGNVELFVNDIVNKYYKNKDISDEAINMAIDKLNNLQF